MALTKMWGQLFVLSAFAIFIVASSESSSQDASSRLYEDRILALLEDIRLRMCYDDPEGLPQLEPFTLEDKLDINIDDDSFGKIVGYIQNLSVAGLSGFIVNYLNFLITLRFAFVITVPKLILSGNYGIKANLGGLIELDGEDKFTLGIEGLELRVNGSFVYQGQMSLRNLRLIVGIDSVDAKIEKLTGDDEVNDFINHVINELLPRAFDEFIPPETIHSLETLIEDFASGYLKDFTAAELLALIAGGGSGLLPPLDEDKACKIPKNSIRSPSASLIGSKSGQK